MNDIILADDHAITRDGLKALLTRHGSKVIAEAESFSSLLDIANNNNSSLIICDCNMPGEGPSYFLNQNKRRNASQRIIFLSGLESGLLFKQLQVMGADGIVSKKDDVEEILIAIQQINQGKAYFSPSVKESIVAAPDVLSNKEYQVFELILQGMSNNKIAETLHNSPGTINTHRVNIMKKFKVHTVVDLVKYAQKNGLLNS